MPEVATWVARLREAFGDAVIDDAIRRSKIGEATFFASENGRTVGTPVSAEPNAWHVDQAIFNRHFCAGCDGSCVGTGQRCPAR
jgi:hypothetical protein